ncbi:hypothetical protein [Bacillus sp. ISL-46]|uniref:hypothetical protein n=1 Tax=Bacillus sp. ISL-46 TaxID=2819129 RepID=UPI001BE7C790|nr:hypothetical protein [Bacillus sp. ISL-46]MBT2723019.1 hypothetical protein [Bacillus sp. ISL-46]
MASMAISVKIGIIAPAIFMYGWQLNSRLLDGLYDWIRIVLANTHEKSRPLPQSHPKPSFAIVLG